MSWSPSQIWPDALVRNTVACALELFGSLLSFTQALVHAAETLPAAPVQAFVREPSEVVTEVHIKPPVQVSVHAPRQTAPPEDGAQMPEAHSIEAEQVLQTFRLPPIPPTAKNEPSAVSTC